MDPSPILREMHSRGGQDEEVIHVGELLEEPGLVTLTGPGGAGKTRLAVEVLHRYAARGGAGWFVDLAPVRDEALTASTVAALLGA